MFLSVTAGYNDMSELDSMETLLGGRPVNVVRRDGGRATVTVRQLGIEDYPEFFRAIQTSEIAQIAILCDRDESWAKTLTPETQTEIVVAGRELNDRFFVPWVQREKERRNLLLDPAQRDAFNKAMELAAREVMQEAARSLLPDTSGTSPQPRVAPSPNSVG